MKIVPQETDRLPPAGPGASEEAGWQRGFALIVTVSVLVLLAVIAVGLLTLSSVTIRGANQSSAQEVARANARMALILAIGDLQKALGPDQRITATADFAGLADGSAVDAGEEPRNNEGLDRVAKGLSTVQPGTRHWTGVFVSNDRAQDLYKKTPTATLDRWLISGQGNPATGPALLTPALQSCSVDVNGKVADPAVASVLVGVNTVGKGAEARDDYVAAPVVPVDVGVQGGLRGAFAYWVGDEGVKGRINMERSNDDDESYASLVAQRRGWETVDGFEAYPEATGDLDGSLPGLVTLASAEVLLPETTGGDPSASQAAFHDATADSRGLLVNSLEGGMRVDLTAALRGGLPPRAPDGAYDNYPVAGGRVIPQLPFRADNLAELKHLKWEHLVRFYNQYEDLDEGTLEVVAGNGTTIPSVAPVITDFRILMGVRLEQIRAGRRETGRYKVFPCGKFAVALANPYSVPMEWDRALEFEIKNITPQGNQPSRIWQLSECVFIPRDGTIDRPGAQRAVFNQAIFQVPPGRLEPGEARAYTQGSKVVRTVATSNQRQVVPMEPFATAAPFDLDRCVEMMTGTEITLPKTMDVRESWQTTLVALEMRLGGSRRGGPLLRRLERFELDNGYFAPNQRRFDSSNAPRLRYPVPLMLYSFQVSQPGMDYKNLMPAGYEMGQRSSTMRTFADFNLRADTVHKAITSYNPPPYFMESNDSAALLPFRPPGGETGAGFTRNLVLSPLFWGHTGEMGSNATVLFDVPRQFTSLAQLQHADLTNDAVSVSISHQPGNAFGNSYATPFVQRSLIFQERTDYELFGSPNRAGAKQFRRNYYDISHILNTSLWDRYFFSTIDDATGVPENPILVRAAGIEEPDPTDPSAVAAGLMIDGAFNVNSTSKDAWKVLLASSKHLVHPADSGATEAAFPRSLAQPAGHRLPPTGEGNDSFSGYRRLTDAELDELAEEIVRQVRKRGPFVSLSHFVNRALADVTREPELSRSGALQTALDESGVNISYDGSRNGFSGIRPDEDRVMLVEKQGAPRADLDGGDLGGRPPDANPRIKDWAVTSRDNNFGAVASIVADREILKKSGSSAGRGDRSREQGYRSTGIPGWVTQADVLQVIGPAIATRSDTFRIRSSGEARDATGRVLATAYCEAIVQRQSQYLDPVNGPADGPDVLNETNKAFGRRFEIVSFRWLSPNEI